MVHDLKLIPNPISCSQSRTCKRVFKTLTIQIPSMNRAFMLGLFLILCISFVNARPRSTKPFEYDRIDEAKKECASIFPPDFDHKPYGDRLYRLPEKLSFVNGDWWQGSDKAPLIPYDDKPNDFFDQSSPLNLISFWITEVDDAHRSTNSVSVNGVLQLGIMIGELFGSKPFDRYPIFNIYPGRSELRMSFQGIVTYNNGEIVMCLIGNAFLPSRDPNSHNPWDWVKEPGYINQPPNIQDDRILLVIHYPDTFTVNKRGIHGSLKSLHPKSSQSYFDEIHISAYFSGSFANYVFSSQKLKACTPYNYKSSFADKNLGAFKGANFCRILQRFLSEDYITVVPNWRCNGTDEFCSKLGPFESGASMTNYGSSKGVALHLQDVRCERMSSKGKDVGLTKVAMVIRVTSAPDALYIVPQRTGLNNMTISAEGMWDPSSGQLCMIGCRGFVNKEGDATCDSRIRLYIPLSFSVKQRSMILGSISSVEESNPSYFPLAFEKRVRVHYAKIYEYNQYYEYSKIELARAVLQKHERFSLETVVKKSFLTFPKVKHAESFLVGLSLLAEDLTLSNPAVPVTESSAHCCCRSPTDVEIEILSIGRMFGHYRSLQKDSIVESEDMTTRYIDSQLELNVSARISLTGPEYGNISDLFVEGLYQPLVGKMYLVGCRDVRGYLNLQYEGTDLEDGFDCRIEVVVSYPPTTYRWLMNPTVRVSIASQRNELDPLFFRPIKLQTVLVVHHPQLQREYVSSSRGVEEILQVLTALIAIGCILSQFFYIKQNLNSVPYVSLVMLAVQALGYGFQLVKGVKLLVDSNENSSAYTTNRNIQVIDYRVKIVVLITLLFTLRLYQRVWRSRIRLISRDPGEPHVPSDRPVLLVTLLIHVCGFGCFLIVNKQQSWRVELKEYLGLVQDFFLLPQVIGNLIWQIDCKPLRKSYFVGLTVIRLLPHVYGYRSSSGIVEQYPFEDSPYLDFYSKQGVIGIPATAILLAIAVHVTEMELREPWSDIYFRKV